MHLRRTLAALGTTLAVLGGGFTLTACNSPTESPRGVPADTLKTSGNTPNNVPDNSDKEPSSTDNGGGTKNGGNGG